MKKFSTIIASAVLLVMLAGCAITSGTIISKRTEEAYDYQKEVCTLTLTKQDYQYHFNASKGEYEYGYVTVSYCAQTEMVTVHVDQKYFFTVVNEEKETGVVEVVKDVYYAKEKGDYYKR